MGVYQGDFRSGEAADAVTGFMHLIRTLLTTAVVTSSATLALAQPIYTLTEVTLPASCVRTVATGLNAGGDVVATCFTNPNDPGRAFAWRSGAAVPLGTLQGGTYSEATAINDLGVVTGHGNTDRAAMLGWVTTAPGLQSFFSNNGGYTLPLFIGNSGFIGGRYTTSKSGWVASIKGAVWTPDPKDPRKYRKTDLPILPGGVDPKLSYSHPRGFNHAGFAVGFGLTDQVASTPALWSNDAAHTLTLLPMLSDGLWGEALAISDAGHIVGFETGGLPQPLFWQNDAAHAVSALPLLPGDTYGMPTAVNDAGVVVGTSGYQVTPTDVPVPHSVVWIGGQVFELQTLLDPLSGQGYTVTAVAGINDAGQIAATATRNGASHAVLLTPAP